MTSCRPMPFPDSLSGQFTSPPNSRKYLQCQIRFVQTSLATRCHSMFNDNRCLLCSTEALSPTPFLDYSSIRRGPRYWRLLG